MRASLAHSARIRHKRDHRTEIFSVGMLQERGAP